MEKRRRRSAVAVERRLTLGMADWMHCSRRLSLSEELSPESLRLGR